MPERVDFSANAEIYDRRHGTAISEQLAQVLASRLQPGATVVDIGAGTGRVALGLAKQGLQVVAVDPAVPMLEALRRKPGEALAVAADGVCLPLRRKSVDAIVVARLLYLVPDWQRLLRGATDVLKQGGILLHEWGNGEASETWVQVREKARSLFQEAGVAIPFHPGARSEHAVDSYVREIGFLRKHSIEAGTGPILTLAEFLDQIESGELSYVWNVPKDIQDSCLPRLRQWCERRFDLRQPGPMPAELHWVSYENVG